MDLRGLLGLDDPIGCLICLSGMLAQLWLARKKKWLLIANAVFAIVLFLFFVILAESLSPRFVHAYGESKLAWTTALIQIWFLTVLGVWAGISLRDRIPAFNASRRAILQASSVAICAAPAAVFAFGILTRKDTVVRQVDIKFRDLPHDLENLRLVQISDVHLGPFYSERDLERVIDSANELRPDLAIMTGDLITTGHDPLEAGIRQLSRLKNNSGIWACMGNHEHFAGVENRAALLGTQYGVNFLRSESKTLRFGSHSLNLVGVDYQPMRLPYLTAIDDLVESDQFNILLSHNPDVFRTAITKGFDLVLAGHTHGGQVNVEIFDKNLNIADFLTPYTKGLYTEAKSAIYVNSGIGTIGMPIRLGAPPEITLIRLCAS